MRGSVPSGKSWWFTFPPSPLSMYWTLMFTPTAAVSALMWMWSLSWYMGSTSCTWREDLVISLSSSHSTRKERVWFELGLPIPRAFQVYCAHSCKKVVDSTTNTIIKLRNWIRSYGTSCTRGPGNESNVDEPPGNTFTWLQYSFTVLPPSINAWKKSALLWR